MFTEDKVIPTLVLGGAVLTIILMFSWYYDHKAFMTSCLEDHKQYECTTLYRGSR